METKEVLLKLRENKGLSQEDLAKELKQVYIFRNREYGEDENISNL